MEAEAVLCNSPVAHSMSQFRVLLKIEIMQTVFTMKRVIEAKYFGG